MPGAEDFKRHPVEPPLFLRNKSREKALPALTSRRNLLQYDAGELNRTMDTPNSQEIEVAGKVITLTRQIESRLVALGASGNGLREKTESLAGKFPREVEKLLAFIGCIRNRIAHEDQPGISPEELQFFEEAVAAVLEELKLPGETAAESAGTPAATLPPPPPPSAPAPAPVSPPAPAVSATPEKPAARPNSPRSRAASSQPAVPPPSRPELVPSLAGRIPLLHLAYAVELAYTALRPTRRPLFLALLEVGSVILAVFALLDGIYYLAGLAGSVFLLSYAGIFYEGWFRSAERMPLPFFLIPGANLGWLLRELLRLTGWLRLAAAFTILAVWVVAILLALRREFSAAGVLALLSYLVSVAATFLPGGGSGE